MRRLLRTIRRTAAARWSSYSVNPALPAGLSLSTRAGAISGTPAAVTPQTKYTSHRDQYGGNATAAVFITVNSGARRVLWRRRRDCLTSLATPRIPWACSIPANVPTSTGGVPLPYTRSERESSSGLQHFARASPRVAHRRRTACSHWRPAFGNHQRNTLGRHRRNQLQSNGQQPGRKHHRDADYRSACSRRGSGRPRLQSHQRQCMRPGSAITAGLPDVNPLGGAPTNYSVTPDLSQIGLTLDPSSGVLSGTPAARLRRPRRHLRRLTLSLPRTPAAR